MLSSCIVEHLPTALKNPFEDLRKALLPKQLICVDHHCIACSVVRDGTVWDQLMGLTLNIYGCSSRHT